MKNGQRKNAQTAATVLSVNAKTSCIYNYTTTAIDRQVPDFEVLDGGCQGVRPRMVGIGFTLLLLTAGTDGQRHAAAVGHGAGRFGRLWLC